MDTIIEYIKDILQRLEILERSQAEEDYTAPTFAGTWVNYDTTHNDAGYYKDKNGLVHLRGLVKSGTVPSTIFTLPAGYRPARKHIFAVLSNNAIGRVSVEADGDVIADAGNTAWISLDGISFRI